MIDVILTGHRSQASALELAPGMRVVRPRCVAVARYNERHINSLICEPSTPVVCSPSLESQIIVTN